jgi:hypothetical protein
MSKLNPQKASAYVGPGVLRKGGKVPNGPLVKKKGPYAGSTLKNGGAIKKGQNGEYLTKEGSNYTSTKKVNTKNGPRYYQGNSPSMSFARELASDKARKINDSIPKAKLSSKALEMMDKKKNGGTMKKKAQEGVKIGKLNLTTTPAKNDTIKRPKTVWVNNPMPGQSAPYVKTAHSKLDDIINQANKKKAGGAIKKAQNGGTYYASSKGRVGRLSGSKIGDDISAIQNESMDTTGYAKGKKDFTKTINRSFEKPSSKIVKRADVPKVISDLKKGATKKMDLRTPNQKNKAKMKAGGMLKRADGSYSKRGLWDNIRANKGSGKKPTKQMLQQEKKIKAKSKK